MARLLNILESEAEKDGVDVDFGLMKGVLDYCLVYPDKYHHPKEDLVYDALQRRDGEIAATVDDLRAEHEELATATEEMALALTEVVDHGKQPGAWLEALCRSFLDQYRSHMRKEEEVFFPEALALLDAADWEEIEGKITNPTDPLFNTKAAQRMTVLRDRLHEGAAL